MASKIDIDREHCLGEAICTALMPDIFEMADDGKATITSTEDIDFTRLKEVMSLCPAKIITLLHQD
ncbi:MAG: ferredoxin [Candidatus Thermoplasmatota archaeon]|nr:ferredoxin [Candidatus Thermoplasmatota archaeon]MCL5731493.1 ferredoxin [Candidatus Thermoplasmatota archaeon]